MSQAFNRFDTGCDWGWKQVFELAFADFLYACFKLFINGVSELILVLDTTNDPVVHFVDKCLEVAYLFLRVGKYQLLEVLKDNGDFMFLLRNIGRGQFLKSRAQLCFRLGLFFGVPLWQ